MYLDFFGFAEKPFHVTPDTRYLYPSPLHQSVLETLRYGVEERKGFLLLTGEVGTGKTISLTALLDQLRPDVETSLILHPQLSRLELLKTINRDFGQTIRKNSFPAQMEALNHFVLRSANQGRNCLVIIDEAQQLPDESLEMTRLLSNLETADHKLLQILLVGQPELEAKLGQPELRQLRQRIQIHCRLEPLNTVETERYIVFRVQKAGPRARATFERSAVRQIHHLSRGIPRLINTICEYCLLQAYVKETWIITKKLVDLAFAETQGTIPYVTYP